MINTLAKKQQILLSITLITDSFVNADSVIQNKIIEEALQSALFFTIPLPAHYLNY